MKPMFKENTKEENKTYTCMICGSIINEMNTHRAYHNKYP